jgi:hypothetical protein
MLNMVNVFALGWIVGVFSSISAFALWSACMVSASRAQGGDDD